MHIQQLQSQVRTWSSLNAPEATPETCMKHIEEELKELRLAMDGEPMGPHGEFMCDTNKITEEMADIVILIAHLATLYGGDLDWSVRNKWERVKQRVYTKHSDGVYRHVREVEELKPTGNRPANKQEALEPQEVFKERQEPSLTDRLNDAVLHIESELYRAIREGKTMRADYQNFGHAVCWADFVRISDERVFCGICLNWTPQETNLAHTKYQKPFKSRYTTFSGWIKALRMRLPGMGTEQWREVEKHER